MLLTHAGQLARTKAEHSVPFGLPLACAEVRNGGTTNTTAWFLFQHRGRLLFSRGDAADVGREGLRADFGRSLEGLHVIRAVVRAGLAIQAGDVAAADTVPRAAVERRGPARPAAAGAPRYPGALSFLG